MATKRDSNAGQGGEFFTGLISKLIGFLGASSQIVAGLRDVAGRKAEAFAARVALLLLLQLWVSAGIFLALLGLFYLLIDSAGVARGLVFAVGGVLISLVSLLLAHFAKKGHAGNSD